MTVIVTRFLTSALLLASFEITTISKAQTPTNAAAAPTSAPPQQPALTASSILQPALDNLQQTLGTLRLEKWKASNVIREETDANLSSIHRDLDTTLPSLLSTADAAPNSVSRILPAFRNIEALYDVLLRVTQVAKLASPGPQSAALDQATASLDEARRALGDRLQSAALAQDKQVADLQAALRAIPPPPPPTPPAPPPPAPPKKRKKAAPKPTPAPATSQGSTTTTPH
ncbi:hypothetical protein [Granulicella sp. dw_53]|uniref:hypothetical protein n=1 Tax=Granulicella sp. dw_53 TaxID=2719792 RepID=UPI001BD37D2C|nr:hypothetical protein [Granulicella sp. dw_53]